MVARRGPLVVGMTMLIAGCAPMAVEDASLAGGPLTVPERTGYERTSSYAETMAFLDSLAAAGAPVRIDAMGETNEGRALRYAIAARPMVKDAAEARATGRPIVFVQGTIHGGEVEGKEALQAILRELTRDARPNALDSIVLIALPIYNADGNDAFGPAETQRAEQNGPDLVGRRTNAQGLDLNRDYIKAEAPETRAALRFISEWGPDVFVDLHATNGSYHGYSLTYAPPLTPGSGRAAALTADALLPELRRRMREGHGIETFDYGNFSLRYGSDVTPDSLREAWYTYDHRPRFGTNYVGVRGGIGILSEAFSHDPFDRRVGTTAVFVREILSLVGERARQVLDVTRSHDPITGRMIPVRSRMTTAPDTSEVRVEMLEHDPDSIPDEPGIHRGIRRTGRIRAQRMPVYREFEPILERRAPAAYAVPGELTAVLELLGDHGVEFSSLVNDTTAVIEAFEITEVQQSPRAFQAHLETALSGVWSSEERRIPAGWVTVRTDQPLGRLVFQLLEPESDDGVVAWCCPAGGDDWGRGFLRGWLGPATEYPIVRLP